jgi:hypothetical protein
LKILKHISQKFNWRNSEGEATGSSEFNLIVKVGRRSSLCMLVVDTSCHYSGDLLTVPLWTFVRLGHKHCDKNEIEESIKFVYITYNSNNYYTTLQKTTHHNQFLRTHIEIRFYRIFLALSEVDSQIVIISIFVISFSIENSGNDDGNDEKHSWPIVEFFFLLLKFQFWYNLSTEAIGTDVSNIFKAIITFGQI